jgi:hypothetical protein
MPFYNKTRNQRGVELKRLAIIEEEFFSFEKGKDSK